MPIIGKKNCLIDMNIKMRSEWDCGKWRWESWRVLVSSMMRTAKSQQYQFEVWLWAVAFFFFCRRDIITIRRGNTVVRTLSGVFRSSSGKRSLSIPLYRDDDRCDRDDDEISDDFFRYDIPYARLAAAYERYRRQRSPRAPCVYVRGPNISINFSSDGNDTGQRGFSARFRVHFRGI